MAKQRKRRQTGSGLPTPVWVGLLAGLVLVAAGLIYLTAQQGTNPTSSNLPYPDVPRVSVAEAYDQQQAGSGIIIDVRDAQYYEEEHAAGALSLPEADILAQLNQLPTDKTLIFY